MFKALDVWMEELEQELYHYYMNAHKANLDWKSARRNMPKENRLYDIQSGLCGDYKGYACWYFTNKYREELVKVYDREYYALIDKVIIDGVEYDSLECWCAKDAHKMSTTAYYKDRDDFANNLSVNSGFGKFLRDRMAYPSHVTLVDGRDEKWIAERAHKDMLKHKKSIEDKIMKICEAIDTIEDLGGEYYVKGTNGRIAHLWRILAGGYNIQCLHTRVLCKEVKTK